MDYMLLQKAFGNNPIYDKKDNAKKLAKNP